jgi:hypothetical protein
MSHGERLPELRKLSQARSLRLPPTFRETGAALVVLGSIYALYKLRNELEDL